MGVIPAIAASAEKGAIIPIYYNSFPSGSSNTSLTNIPQIYRDLIIQCTFQSNASYTATGFWSRINGDGGTNYSMVYGAAQNSSVISGSVANNNIGAGAGPNFVSGIPCTITIHLLNYANTTTYKTFLQKVNNDTAGGGTTYSEMDTMCWRSTAAVTEFDLLFPGGNSQLQVLQFAVYGVRSAS